MDLKEFLKEKFLENQPQSYWITSTAETDYPSLNEDIKVDVAIVGGGMVGITSAFLLKREGLTVAVIEADRIVQGTTGHTTAKITSQHSLIYNKIKTNMGEERARQYAEANESAIDFIKKIIEEKNIDCDFSHQPAYIYTNSDKYIQKVMDEAKTASNLGIKAEFVEEIPLPIPIKGAVRFDSQAQFHPRKYLLSLAKDIPGNGSYIFEQTKAVDIKRGSTFEVITHNGNKVTAKKVIVASHYPFYDVRGLYFARIYTERSYVLAAKIKEKFPEGMYINAESPTRSLRSVPFENKELVLFIGEHHKTGQGQDMNNHYKALFNFATEFFTVENILYRWSTQDCMTLDGVPYVGQYVFFTPGLYIATGFGKWGMTNSTVSAMLLRDLIVKGKSPWEDVYNPSRFTPIASAKNFIMANADVAEKFILGKLIPAPDDVDINPEEGKVIEINGEKVGAYKDNEGKLHLVDITCTHMGCELKWNAAEKSWDCPCHGSRYTYDGDIVEGPTTKPLRRIKID
jgi:glycine/D-amino acid oxidase-like deaminating enzyme/nitrite reductase/ring-hydroxylating ferredoxin subunit